MNTRHCWWLAVVLAGNIFTSQPSHAALTTYYRFDDGTGTAATEATGTIGDSNATLGNGTNNLPTWVTGQLGDALHFSSASQQYAIAPTYAKPTTAMTLSIWAVTDTTQSEATIVKNWGSGTPGQFHIGFEHDTNDVSLFTNGPNPNKILDPTAMTNGTWYLFGFVIDNVAKTQTIYRNGVAVKTQAYTGSFNSSANVPAIGIGVKTNDPGTAPGDTSYWNGALDDFGIFNTALSAGAMKAIYNLALDSTVSTFGTSNKYDLGTVSQLLTAYSASSSATVDGDSWNYATDLGSIKGSANPGDLFSSGGSTYLLLDGIANTGMQLNAVPEPSTLLLGSMALASICVAARDRIGRRLAGR